MIDAGEEETSLALHLFPRFLLGIFASDSAITDVGVGPLHTIILIVPILGIQVIGSTFFVAVGKAIPALILGLSRQVLLLTPLLVLLPLVFGLPGVWWAFPIADGTATVLAAVLLVAQLRRLPTEKTVGGE